MIDDVRVADMCEEGMSVQAVLVVVTAEMRSFSSKPGQYLWMKLRDASGEIEAKMWQAPANLRGELEPGTPVKVRGRVSRWREKFDLVLDTCEPVSPDSVDSSLFLPAAPEPADDMWDELTSLLKRVQDADYLALVNAFLSDEDLVESFRRAPASRNWHHGYLGGLLEHTLGVVRICVEVAGRRRDVDHSLLVTGALFHDIGKIDDYRFDTVIDRTQSGRLVGHIVSGYGRLVTLCSSLSPALSADKFMQVGHIIVSHHGKPEWGSPQRPKTMEAQIVHYADNLDAQVNGFGLVMAEGRSHDSEWSSFHRLLGTEVFCGGDRGDGL